MTFVFTQSLGYAVNHSAILIKSELLNRFHRAGFNIAAEEWAVLALLHEEQDGVVQGELAKRTIKDKTTVVRMVDKLSRKGLTVRKPSDKDMRVKYVHLTEQGLALCQLLIPIAQEFLQELQFELTEQEKTTVIRALGKLTARLNQLGQQ